MAKKRIMVVENEGITAMRILNTLEEMGYAVTQTVFSGVEAVKKAKKDKPDLVLMDIVLRGEMDGIEAAGQIHSRFNIPVVYLTANSDEKMLKRIKKTEPFGYIIKPVEERELHIAVEIALYKHEMEEKLRESERRHRTLFKNATDAIYLIDPKTQRIIDCNPKAAKISAYTLRELKTMTVAELHPKTEQGVVSKIFEKISERSILSGISGINQLRRDGKLVPVEINAAIIELQGKKCILCIIRDITERKKAEEELRYEKNKLVGIFNAMEDGVQISSREYEIEYINPLLKKEFGPVKGRKCYEYFHHRKSVCPGCKIKAVSAGKTIRWEWFSSTTNKTYDIIGTPLINPDGSISKLEILRDITKRKKMEEQLKEAAITDDLTGLFNRRGFFALANKQCKLADRTKRLISLLYLDIDGLKTINDELGHKEGDKALIDTSNILKRTFRESDIIARVGGDEFTVLLTEPSGSDVKNVAVDHLQNKLKEFNLQAGRNYELILSIGMACYDPECPCSIDKFLMRADDLMYKDKKHHKLLQNTESVLKTKVEKRQYKRYTTGGNCRAELDSSDKVRIKDISNGGICLKTSQHLYTGSIYKIRMFSADNEELTTRGVVVWSSLTGKGTDEKNSLHQYESGLRFIEIKDISRSFLENFQ